MIEVDLPRQFLRKVVIIKIDEEVKIIGKLLHYESSGRSPQHKPGFLVLELIDGRRVIARSWDLITTDIGR